MPTAVEHPQGAGPAGRELALWKRIRKALKEARSPLTTPQLLAAVSQDGVTYSRGRLWKELEMMELRDRVVRGKKRFDKSRGTCVVQWKVGRKMP